MIETMASEKRTWPENVGILAMEIYFPSQYVDQEELEAFDGVSAGKYTIGLGQKRMGFCSDLEDINSLCMTVVHNLMQKTGTEYSSIGRLEVGTETLVDKSKSVKSVLMQLFPAGAETDVEGVDTTNACYGGTAALFNALNWVESSSWDGRLALVVCGDIAVYASGSARPTGGAGAVAMLVGPHAPLVVERGLRSSHMQHAYDFYKPDLSSEYPVVDGRLSIQSYLGALDQCYRRYRQKAAARPGGSPVTVDSFDAVLFHSPFGKLVQKSLARLVFNDFLQADDATVAEKYPGLEELRGKTLEESYFDRDVEKAFMERSREQFEKKTRPSLLLASNVGNMYTPSLYSCLVSLLVSKKPDELTGTRIALFSYGSGLASSLFSIRVATSNGSGSRLEALLACVSDVMSRLESRQKVPPQVFADTMKLREESHHLAPYQPKGDPSVLFPGTYYLTGIDEKHRRQYSRAT
ncbi:hydroxymethylglutaryl-CoA synthase 1-like isoform X2 [Amphibalanus amphitrite]|uniref:hydroxymethylglutaryl-CoA synthase 1-like isoform X2 n=2 Tax=Amphibalanus amphitrite TaxID=1232801 RepID=UPI001C920061|nr:hydroxymethylglutaryl-CoA synthase 1-like isoform X2 [Amphibalanus amphitrite]